MIKKLAINKPIASAYAHIGIAFSLFSTNEKFYPWLINNYIQIYALKDMAFIPERTGTLDFFYNQYGDWEMFHFTSNPYLDYEKLSFTTLDVMLAHLSLIDFLMDAINNDKYIYIPIDMYELPVYGAYKIRHRVHHLFITGYNSQDKVFYAYDTFAGGQYRCEKIDFSALEKAYYTLRSDPVVSSWSEIGGICFYRLHMKPWQSDKSELYELNLKSVISGIQDYLMLPNHCQGYRHISHFRYGIDCYIELENWLKTGMDSEDSYVDHRAFSSMRDHKRVMLFRLNYISKKMNIDLQKYIDKYEKINRDFDLLIYKILKGNLSKNIRQFSDCIQLLQNIKTCEICTLSAFLEEI